MYMVVVQHVTYGIEFAVSWQYQMDKATKGGGGYSDYQLCVHD